MATRVQAYISMLGTVLNPRVAVPIALRLHGPAGYIEAVNLEGTRIVFGPQSDTTTASASDGSYTISGDTVDDLSPAGCWYSVIEGGIETPLAYHAYSGTALSIATLISQAVVAGLLLMLQRVGYNDGSGIPGQSAKISISDNALAPDGTQLVAGIQKGYDGDSEGYIHPSAYPSSVLIPSDTVYLIQWPDGNFDTFTVPIDPTGYQGMFDFGITYFRKAGTKTSPSDVVLWTDGLLYQYINATPAAGHLPSDSVYWQPFPGEPIYWNLVGSGGSAGAATGTLELQDANTDLTRITKLSVIGLAVGGTSSAATLKVSKAALAYGKQKAVTTYR